MEIFDIHSHILPGVDDGSKSMEMTEEMLEMAHSHGVRTIFATPHYSMRSRDDKPARVMEAYEKTREMALKKFPDMKILLGCEVYMEPGMIERLKTETTITMNRTKYVLCEYSFVGEYKDMYDSLQQLVRARFKPVLAHVERYRCLREEWGRLHELREMGVLMQINAESLQGNVFDKNFRYGKSLIKHGVIDFIGSDAHDMEKRAPRMEKAVDTLIKMVGEHEADKILRTNAEVFLH